MKYIINAKVIPLLVSTIGIPEIHWEIEINVPNIAGIEVQVSCIEKYKEGDTLTNIYSFVKAEKILSNNNLYNALYNACAESGQWQIANETYIEIRKKCVEIKQDYENNFKNNTNPDEVIDPTIPGLIYTKDISVESNTNLILDECEKSKGITNINYVLMPSGLSVVCEMTIDNGLTVCGVGSFTPLEADDDELDIYDLINIARINTFFEACRIAGVLKYANPLDSKDENYLEDCNVEYSRVGETKSNTTPNNNDFYNTCWDKSKIGKTITPYSSQPGFEHCVKKQYDGTDYVEIKFARLHKVPDSLIKTFYIERSMFKINVDVINRELILSMAGIKEEDNHQYLVLVTNIHDSYLPNIPCKPVDTLSENKVYTLSTKGDDNFKIVKLTEELSITNMKLVLNYE